MTATSTNKPIAVPAFDGARVLTDFHQIGKDEGPAPQSGEQHDVIREEVDNCQIERAVPVVIGRGGSRYARVQIPCVC